MRLDVGLDVARRDPVQRPAPGWLEPDTSPGDALLAHLDIDLELPSPRAPQRDPDFAGDARAIGKQTCGSDECASEIGHPGARRGRIKAGDRYPSPVVAAIQRL